MLADIQFKLRECLLTFSSNSGKAYWRSVNVQGILVEIQFKFREFWQSVKIQGNACRHSVQTQGMFADIQFKFKESLLTFSYNSGNICWCTVQFFSQKCKY